MYKLGKKPASPLGQKAIMFSDIFNAAKMPIVPKVFGKPAISTWFMYGNDEFGDCVWASKAHTHMFVPLLGGYARDTFWTNNVLSDYAACTGFRVDDPNTDQGTDMKQAAEYHRLTGVLDSKGQRHRVQAYVNMTPGDINQLAMGAFLFGAVEMGVQMSDENMNQFDQGVPWTPTKTPPNGGHCVPVFGRDKDGNFLCVSWGKVQRIAPSFIQKNMDEGITYLNTEIINKAGLAPGAYNLATMTQMLAKVSPQPVIKTFAEQMAELVESVGGSMGYGIVGSATPNFPTEAQFDVAFKMLRGLLDQSGYGWAMSDAKLRPYSNQIAIGVVAASPPAITEGAAT